MSSLLVIPSRKAIHGKGRAELHVYGDNAHFAELSYTYPLKLLSPRLTTAGENEAAQRVAILYSLTYGGGLIGGDRVELLLDVKARAKLVLLTQVCIIPGRLVYMSTYFTISRDPPRSFLPDRVKDYHRG